MGGERVNLNAWQGEKRRKLFDDLVNGREPSEGSFSLDALKEGRAKGKPQMGSVRYEPDQVVVEFIYSDSTSSATVFTVTLTPPERIVFLPVPSWVIESIWQGEIAGSHHFESDARRLLREFEADLEPEANKKLFGPQPAKRRE